MSFFGSNNKEVENLFTALVNPNLSQAIKNYHNAVNNFHDSDGFIINYTCPSCGNKGKLDCYNKKSNDAFDNGIFKCNNCDNYIEFKIRVYEDETIILFRKYDSFENLDICDRMVKHISTTVSIDDLKCILSNTDLTSEDAALLRKIKAALESKGIIFDDKNNNKGE